MTDVILPIPAAVAAKLESGVANVSSFTPESLLDPQVCQRLRIQLRDHAGLDVFRSTIEPIRSRLEMPPHAVVVRGIRFDPSDYLLLGLTTSLGEVAYPTGRAGATAVNLVVPRTDFTTARWGNNNEALHTDSTRWRIPNRYTCLQCVRADDGGGGETILLSVEHIIEYLEHRHPDLLAFLRDQPVPWGLDHGAAGEDSEVLWQPILSGPFIRWARFSIGTTAGDRPFIELPQSCEQHLRELQRVLATHPATTSQLLRPNDLLIIDNHRALHARAKVADARSSRRLLRRVRIAARAIEGDRD